jgi:hypothetical protein
MRRSLLAVSLMLTATACGGGSGSPALSSSTPGEAVPCRAADYGSSPCSAPTGTLTSAGYVGSVRWPSCFEPEYRPSFWTSNCGDAGSSLDGISYTVWGARQAQGLATYKVTKGGPYFEAKVTFTLDRPTHTPDFGDVFGRLTVNFPQGGDPDGRRVTTTDLVAMLADARASSAQGAAAQQSPCQPPDCAPDPQSS